MPAETLTAPPQTLVETDMPRTADLPAVLLDDGQPWDEDRAIRAIHHELENILVSANRIGRVLIQAKAHLGHGAFGAWVEASGRS